MDLPDQSTGESRQHLDDLLDEALEDTFPSSDAVQLSPEPRSAAGNSAAPRIWFVTGSARGLGREIVVAALDAGDRVVATARDTSALDDIVARHPGRVVAVALDVTDEAQATDAVAKAQQAFGRIDVVVNNAGYANVASVEDMTSADFRRQVETNFFGVVSVTRAAIPALRVHGSGHIFQIASVGARIAVAGLSAYQSAKFAVRGFSLVLAQELQPLGIKVTVIEPGGIRTDWAGSSMAAPGSSPSYEETVGRRAAMLRANVGRETSDPVNIARILVALAGRDDAPVELLLGSDAVTYSAQAAAAVAASDLRWADISRSADAGAIAALDFRPAAPD